MLDPGKVQGEQLVELFQHLIDHRTILSMSVVGTAFERLTCVTRIDAENGQSYVCVDMPDGFKVAAGRAEYCRLRFNFNGPDQLEYIFNTAGGAYLGREIKIPFPEFVERLQRRKHFRILTPPGTRLLFKQDKLHVIISLINVSMGGAFGALVKHSARKISGPILAVDQQIYGMGIIFPADEEIDEKIVIVKRAQVRRMERDIQKDLYKYAFEFMEIAPRERYKLTECIYRLQRQFLQRR
jgi:c-di-GMP-binding flagellar brake protein YcgR